MRDSAGRHLFASACAAQVPGSLTALGRRILDGIVEANDRDGREFGRDRLELFFLNSAGQQPIEFMDELFQKIATGAQQDDLTAVLAQFG